MKSLMEKILEGFSPEDRKKIQEIIGSFNPKIGLASPTCVVIVKDFSGPHKTRGWDVRICSSIIHAFFKSGEMYRYEFDPHYEYQDYPGGQTYRHLDLDVFKVLSFDPKDKKVVVEMQNGSKKEMVLYKTTSFKRSYQKGPREARFDEDMEVMIRFKYEGDPSDLDFSKKTETDL